MRKTQPFDLEKYETEPFLCVATKDDRVIEILNTNSNATVTFTSGAVVELPIMALVMDDDGIERVNRYDKYGMLNGQESPRDLVLYDVNDD